MKTSEIYLKAVNSELSRDIGEKNKRWILDVGCGIGYFLSLAKIDGYNVEGADISKWAGIYAKKRFDIDVNTGNFLEMNFPENKFDIITLWQTIEHLPNPIDFIRKAHKILKPGGFICMATPDVDSWISHFYKKYWNCYMPNEHIILFNFNSMKTILESNGFSSRRISRLRDRGFISEQFQYTILLNVRLIKNFVLKTKIFKPLVPKKLLSKWENQSEMEIPLPSISYSVFAIGQKV